MQVEEQARWTGAAETPKAFARHGGQAEQASAATDIGGQETISYGTLAIVTIAFFGVDNR